MEANRRRLQSLSGLGGVSDAALTKIIEKLRAEPRLMEEVSRRRLHAATMALMDEVASPKAPKSHLFPHLTLRIPHWGNPRFYSTYLDESLNRTFIKIAASCHRRTFERRMFSKFKHWSMRHMNDELIVSFW